MKKYKFKKTSNRDTGNDIQQLYYYEKYLSIAHIFFVSTIWFDCRTQSNSIHGLGSIVFD